MYSKRLFIVFIITCIAAYSTGKLLDHTYKKRWATLFFEKTDALVKDSTNYDIIFLGNSRVHFGINPFYVDSVTKLSSYNFANGGSDAEDILLTSSVYLQKHPAPKLAVISLDMGALNINESLKTCYHYLFYLDNDTINKYMKRAGYLTGLIKSLPFTKYSFFNEYNRTSLFIKGNQYPEFGHNIYKGFLNIHPHMNSKAVGLFNPRPASDRLWDTAIIYFRNAVAEFQQKGTTVVFVFPPERISSMTRQSLFRKTADSVFKSIADEYHLTQFHFENNPVFSDAYFVDDIHLNEPGSKIYSMQLSDSIKKIFPGK